MKKREIYPIIVTVAAIAAVIVRLWELNTGFSASGVATDHVSVSVMRITAAAAVILCAALGVIAAPMCFDFERCMCVGAGKMALEASGFLLAVSGLVGIMLQQGEMSRMILSAFAIFGGVCLILSARAKGGALIVVPVFFGCFLMLVLYVENAGSAVQERYGYLILAAASGTTALYSAASSAYRIRRSRFRLAACGIATVLTAVAVATAIAEGDIQLAVSFGALLVLAAGEMLAVCMNGLDEDIADPKEVSVENDGSDSSEHYGDDLDEGAPADRKDTGHRE